MRASSIFDGWTSFDFKEYVCPCTKTSLAFASRHGVNSHSSNCIGQTIGVVLPTEPLTDREYCGCYWFTCLLGASEHLPCMITEEPK